MCVSTDGDTYNASGSIFAEAEATVVDIHGAIVSLETQGTHTAPTIHLILHGTEIDTGLASCVLHNARLHKAMQHMQSSVYQVCTACSADLTSSSIEARRALTLINVNITVLSSVPRLTVAIVVSMKVLHTGTRYSVVHQSAILYSMHFS